MSCIAICGDSASGKTVMAELLARELGDVTILECDRYHKWERQSGYWQTEYTHLNPQANHIDLMHQDVVDLKNGKSIFRRDYDHGTGTFTEEREIRPSRHLIVVGLHTLMRPDLYDLKIFMDPSTNLKTQWKITRDVSKRGYTYEQVKEQITKRRKDYDLFIEPLKIYADIVSNGCDQDDIVLKCKILL